MANGLLSKQIPDAFAGLLYPDPSVNYRGMLAPFLKRTVTDPIDDVSEYEQTEFAMPSLLYDPLQGLAGMGQMIQGERPVDPREITKTAVDIGMLSAPVGGLLVPKGAVLGAFAGRGAATGDKRVLKSKADFSGDKVYKINTTGDAVVGDEVSFDRAIFSGSFRKPKFEGYQNIKGKIIKDSYGADKQQHTFTIEMPDGSKTRIKGRNLYKEGTYRKPWKDESLRKGVAEEKHQRGDVARKIRATRTLDLGADKAPTDTPSGLLDDTASRMQRAQDMGFDVDLTRYHQTSPAAKKEIMKGGFDPSIIGARWSDPLMPDGVFMKSGKDKLAGLTQGKQTQMPLMTRAQNTKAFQNRGELETFLSKDKQWKKMRDKQTALQDDATKLYQAVDTGKITEKDALVNLFGFDPKEVNKLDDVEVFDAFDGVIRDMAGTTSAELRARATEVFKKKGFDSVSVAEDWGGPFGKTVTDTFIVFDEKMLRSPKAKFDPAKAGSADLLAANPPTAGILGLLSQQNNEN